MKTIAQLTAAEMVAEYNALTGKSIKKFSSRAAGESQLAKARAEAPTTTITTESKVTEQKSPSLPKSILRSKAIRESWANDSVAKKRARRDNVIVEGVGTYRSVCEAFKKLNLPLDQHIKFRMSVKQDGQGLFRNGDKKYHFKLAESGRVGAPPRNNSERNSL